MNANHAAVSRSSSVSESSVGLGMGAPVGRGRRSDTSSPRPGRAPSGRHLGFLFCPALGVLPSSLPGSSRNDPRSYSPYSAAYSLRGVSRKPARGLGDDRGALGGVPPASTTASATTSRSPAFGNRSAMRSLIFSAVLTSNSLLRVGVMATPMRRVEAMAAGHPSFGRPTSPRVSARAGLERRPG